VLRVNLVGGTGPVDARVVDLVLQIACALRQVCSALVRLPVSNVADVGLKEISEIIPCRSEGVTVDV
jgi:hypothetical protein